VKKICTLQSHHHLLSHTRIHHVHVCADSERMKDQFSFWCMHVCVCVCVCVLMREERTCVRRDRGSGGGLLENQRVCVREAIDTTRKNQFDAVH